MGGRAAHVRGRAHEWTSSEARQAGHLGGIAARQQRQVAYQVGRAVVNEPTPAPPSKDEETAAPSDAQPSKPATQDGGPERSSEGENATVPARKRREERRNNGASGSATN